MSNISIQKMGFCRNNYIKYIAANFSLLCDNEYALEWNSSMFLGRYL